MGEHKHKKTTPQMIVTDLDDVEKVLADEKLYCEICGAALSLWPPELIREHSMTVHAAASWPAIVETWENYKRDSDLARRENFRNKLRVEFLFQILQHRRDLYDKLVVAGVIREPAQG